MHHSERYSSLEIEPEKEEGRISRHVDLSKPSLSKTICNNKVYSSDRTLELTSFSARLLILVVNANVLEDISWEPLPRGYK